MPTSPERVCVMGLGYIGLPTASLLAMRGFTVRGVDVNPRAVETINRGEIPICEPELDVLVRSAVNSGQLRAALEPAPAEVFIIAVPTPFRAGHAPDLSYIEAATRMIAPHVKPGDLVILESTSPVGTTEKIGQWLQAARPELTVARRDRPAQADQVHLVHCPERVLPGRILLELVSNDRVIGGIDPASAEAARALYARFVTGKLLLTDARTAEMCKLTENAFRDVNIAFANELSLICAELEIDVWELIGLANHHPRVNILKPGPGVGGHCIAVDPWFIVDSAPQTARLIRTAREVNDAKPESVVRQVLDRAARFKEPVVACLGLAFKADIDDLRESPAVRIVAELAARRAGRLLAVEPYIRELPEKLRQAGVTLAETAAAIEQADIVLLLVDHQPFKEFDRARLRDKLVIDTRGIWR